MTQYQVPQFIEIEDRIIGPLTLKQFLYLAFAGAVLFVLWFLFSFYLWIIVAVPVAGLAVVFAFVKINDRPFVYFFLAFIRYFTKPKIYVFSVPVPTLPSVETKPQAPTVPSGQEIKRDEMPKAGSISASGRLKELALKLDAGK